jgi:hypothetical protein
MKINMPYLYILRNFLDLQRYRKIYKQQNKKH